MPSSPAFNTTAGVAVASATGLAVFGPLIGLSTAWIALGLGGALLGLTVDAAQLNGMGGHLLAESLPGGRKRLRRVAFHEAGHWLVVSADGRFEGSPDFAGLYYMHGKTKIELKDTAKSAYVKGLLAELLR